MKELLKLGLTLFIITAVCAGMLGLINNMTMPVIAENLIDSQQYAMKMLIEDADKFVETEKIADDMIEEIYIAMLGNQSVGTIVKVKPNGYGGIMAVLVGLDIKGEVKGIKILSHTETPGFGANATKESFMSQFFQKLAPLKVTKTTPQENEIAAITGATITSDAIVEGVNRAARYVIENQEDLQLGGN